MNLAQKLQKFRPFRYAVITPRAEIDLGTLVRFPDGYHATNPSVLILPDGRLLVAVRGVNYQIKDDIGLQPIFTAGSAYHSLTRCFVTDMDGTPIAWLGELDDALAGFEDVRLFKHRDDLYAIGSRSPESVGESRNREMALLRIGADFKPDWTVGLASPFGFRIEKNWIPFSMGDRLCFLHSAVPLVVLAFDPENRTTTRLELGSRPVGASDLNFRLCGSAAIAMPDRSTLFILHTRSVRLPKLRKVYLSCFATMAPSGGELKFGPYFSIGPPTIQFIAGMTITDASMLLSYGQFDREARLATFDRTALAHLMPR